MLTVIDEFTRRCMAVVVERRLNLDNVLHCLTELFVQHGPPDHIRSDNGSEFTAHAVRDWLGRIGVKTLYIEPGSPWENGYNESFNSTGISHVAPFSQVEGGSKSLKGQVRWVLPPRSCPTTRN